MISETAVYNCPTLEDVSSAKSLYSYDFESDDDEGPENEHTRGHVKPYCGRR